MNVHDLNRASSRRKFLDWQTEYARKNIATFPVLITADGKKPLIRHYQHIGLDASSQLARRFANAPGIAFMAGLRNMITVLDIDEPGDKPLQKALDRHGETPVLVRTASGKHHAWFRHNGERRAVRPEPNNQIDILGNGMVVAPPSHGPKGNYQFIAGSLDDLDNLPIMRNVPERALPRSVSLAQIRQPQTIGRNDALWRFCMKMARRCDSPNQLLDHAHQFNSELPNPLQEEEIVKTAASAWEYEKLGKNRFGQYGAYFPIEMIEALIRNRDTDAFALLAYLRAHNGPWADFWIANGLATIFGWGDKRLAAARERLLERGDVIVIKPPCKNRPGLYQWP
jgi:hypothetical protein